jgi:arginase
LTLGGCHSVAIGTISAAARKNPDLGVIWVDAHADINTPEGSASGNIHGMPLAFLTGIAKVSPFFVALAYVALNKGVDAFSWLTPCITPDRIAYIGLRDVDKGEKATIKEKNILAFSMHEVDKLGIAEVC